MLAPESGEAAGIGMMGGDLFQDDKCIIGQTSCSVEMRARRRANVFMYLMTHNHGNDGQVFTSCPPVIL